MVKKPKTVAFRVTEEEYEALLDQLAFHKNLPDVEAGVHIKTVAGLIEYLLANDIATAVQSLRYSKKQAAAAAKRKATRDAKKAANDDTK